MEACGTEKNYDFHYHCSTKNAAVAVLLPWHHAPHLPGAQNQATEIN